MAEAIEHAIERLRTAFWSERDPEGRAFAPLADAYREKGDLPRALDIVQEGLTRHPEFTSGHVVAGRVHIAMGSMVEAETCFRRVLEFDPENTVALQAMGELAEARGGHAEAAEYYRRLATLNPATDEAARDSDAAVDLSSMHGGDARTELESPLAVGQDASGGEAELFGSPISDELLESGAEGLEADNLFEVEDGPLDLSGFGSDDVAADSDMASDPDTASDLVMAADLDMASDLEPPSDLEAVTDLGEAGGQGLDEEAQLEATGDDGASTDEASIEGVSTELDEDGPLDEIWDADRGKPLGDDEGPSMDDGVVGEETAESFTTPDQEFNFEVTDLSQGAWDDTSETVDPDTAEDLALADAAGLDPLALDVQSGSGWNESESANELEAHRGSEDASGEASEAVSPDYDEEDDVPDDPVAYLNLNGDGEELVVEPVGEFLVSEALAAQAEENVADESHQAESPTDLGMTDDAGTLSEEDGVDSGLTVSEGFQALLGYQPRARVDEEAATAPGDSEAQLRSAPEDPEDLQPRDWTWTPLNTSGAGSGTEVDGASSGAAQVPEGSGLPIVAVESLAPDPVDIQELAPDDSPPVGIQELAPAHGGGSADTSPTNTSPIGAASSEGDSADAPEEGEEAVAPSDFQAWLDRNRL